MQPGSKVNYFNMVNRFLLTEDISTILVNGLLKLGKLIIINLKYS